MIHDVPFSIATCKDLGSTPVGSTEVPLNKVLIKISKGEIKMLAQVSKTPQLRFVAGYFYNPAGLSDNQFIKQLFRELKKTGDDSIKRSVYRTLTRLVKENRAINFLVDKNENKSDRAYIAWLLGELENKRAVGPLINRLVDKEENNGVRVCSAASLGKLKDKRAVGPLINCLVDKNEYTGVRVYSAAALGSLKDMRANDILLDCLQDDTEHPDVRLHAAWALMLLNDKRAVEPLIDFVAHEKNEERREVASSILKDMLDEEHPSHVPNSFTISNDGIGLSEFIPFEQAMLIP